LRRRVLRLAFVLAVPGMVAMAGGTDLRESGEELFAVRCSVCHEVGEDSPKAPPLQALRQMGWAQVQFALAQGSMQPYAAGLSRQASEQLVAFVTGEPERVHMHLPAHAFCSPAQGEEIDFDRVLVGSWGFDGRSTRFQGHDRTDIDAANVHRLELKWAFGVPRTAMMRSMPVITADTVFLATLRGDVFALSKQSGCIRWVREFGTPMRTALHLAWRLDGSPVLYVGDTAAGVNAIDARTGELVWRTSLRLTPWSMLTGSPVRHGSRLIVPVSSFEVTTARNPAHECCRSRGAVVALDAETGAIQWQTFMTAEPEPTFRSSVGVQQWGPSGASVWSTPTVDAVRGLVYVGTGQNNSSPATALSDSIVALDIATGEIRWAFQGTAGDAYNDACVMRPPGPNCPPERGPDFDFGASAIIVSGRDGRELLLAGQKSGTVYALDPDDGSLVWSRRLSQGSWLGGVHFGMAAVGDRVLVPINDPEYEVPGYEPRAGITALAIADGRLLWEQRISRGCELSRDTAGRRTPWPACSFFYGYSAAASAAPGVAFAAGTDGKVRAYATDDGRLLWETTTARPFATVNGVAGHGGAIGNSGVQPAGRMIFVQSGYSLHGLMPGNVLLAYALPDAEPGARNRIRRERRRER
jgi:polyvinyl alcohol dehydrogenase (cytochrome)